MIGPGNIRPLPGMLTGLALWLVLTPPRAQADTYPPKPGSVHPQIVLKTIEQDRAIALSSFRGKKVLLVHFASW